MSRSFKPTRSPLGTTSSAAVQQAQQLAAQQLAGLSGGLSGIGIAGIGGVGMNSTLGSTGQRTLNGSSTFNKTQLRPSSASVRTPSRTGGTRRPVNGARGSAAPSGGGGDLSGIDLSSFTLGLSPGLTMPNTNSSHTANPSDDQASGAPAALENEYIVNLQQQVYFLELELNLLKKAGSGTNSQALRGSGAPPAGGGGASSNDTINDATVPDAPLDDVMLSLREKYVRMEAEYKSDLNQLKQENGELRSRARMREMELGNLKQLHLGVNQELDKWKTTSTDYQSTLLDHQLANEQMILKLTTRLQKRETKLERVQQELLALKGEFKIQQEQYTTEREAYTQKWNERESKMDELNSAYLHEKEVNLEWEEKFRVSNEAQLIQRINDLESRQLGLESETKKSELKYEQAEKNRQSALESMDRLIQENEDLRTSLQTIENDIRERNEKEERDRKSKIYWSSEVANMQTQITALTEKLTKINSKYHDTKQQKKEMKNELIQSRVYLEELTKRITEEQDLHNQTQQQQDSLSETLRTLKRDLTMKTDELGMMMKKYKEIRDIHTKLTDTHNKSLVELTELRERSEIAQSLKGLKLHEFVEMAHSNLKVAGAIENLMGKMKGKEREKRRESGGKVEERKEREYEDSRDDLYSDTGSITDRFIRERQHNHHHSHSPHNGSSIASDSRPTTQGSNMTNITDSRPMTAASSSIVESSFEGI